MVVSEEYSLLPLWEKDTKAWRGPRESDGAEPSRSWMRGARRQVRDARQRVIQQKHRNSACALRAIWRVPLTQLRLSSLALAKPAQPSPTRGEGNVPRSRIGERR
jgi:hypothetical protein